jgi:PAS domain S-box-containing protein
MLLADIGDKSFYMGNRMIGEMLGYDEEETKTLGVMDIHPEDGLPYVMQQFEKQARREITLARDIPVKRKDGSVFYADVNSSIATLHGKSYLLGVFRDITERKRVEEEKTRMELQLRQAQKLESIGQLAAGIAHEINTPTQYVGDNTRFLQDAFKELDRTLQAYRRLLEAARAGPVPPDIIQEVEAIIEQADIEYQMEEIPKAIDESLQGVDRVSAIVRAMREFSHPGTREKTAIDIHKSIENTILVTRNEWKYVSHVKTDFDPSIPSIPCHPGDFNQTILNLIVNAAQAIAEVVDTDAGEKGEITVSTRLSGDWVEIRVSDTGAGIPEEIKARIFDPFFTSKEVGKGTGQGLAIAHAAIVGKHNGSITFESEVGRGTTFIIRLATGVSTAETGGSKHAK